MDGRIENFCPVCGEFFPYHHSGVKHDFESPLMQAYHARQPLPEDDPHVIAIREHEAKTDRENAELVASNDLSYLKRMEWSMGNGQCPVCCGKKPGFHAHGMSGYVDENGEHKMRSLYEAHPELRDEEKHEDGCELAARIVELAATAELSTKTTRIERASVFLGDALDAYSQWLAPTCIIADGPYGLGKFPGEPNSPDSLAEWYAPHAAAWARHSEPFTTLWFWNSEIGWVKSHPALEMHGWQYEEAVVWNKGIAHVAGNCNSKTIRGMPVVTELAVRYTRKAMLETINGQSLPLKEWLRAEWLRSGLPMYQSNQACGVANAATRKYLTQCRLWYFPPGEAVVAMAAWCTKHGASTTRPYFSLDGWTPVTAAAWDRMRAKWSHSHGLTNVWAEPPVHGGERIRVANGSGYLHANQKPLALMERQILASTEREDVVWEPFGGLCSATVAGVRLGRRVHAAEMNPLFYAAAVARVRKEVAAFARKVS